jgi:tetratricopeptide (TPR) repeat protein
MLLKSLAKSTLFRLYKLKLVGLALFCFIQSTLFVLAQQPNKLDDNSPCKSAYVAAQQAKYANAAKLIKLCLESGSQVSNQTRSENLLLGAEIEFYLGNDSQAATYVVLAENYYASLTAEQQKAVGWFAVKLKKIRADIESESGSFQPALKFYKEGLAILVLTDESAQNSGGESRRLKADLLCGVSFVQLKTGLYSEAVTNLEAALAVLDGSLLDNELRPFILNDFGHLLNEQRSHREAINYLEKAREIWEKQKDWRNLAVSQQNLAVAYRGTGDYKQAQAFFESVREFAVENNIGDLVTISSQGLASLYQLHGEHRQAVEILQKSLGHTFI